MRAESIFLSRLFLNGRRQEDAGIHFGGGKVIYRLLALIFVINISGKGNLAPSTASDAVQNYVLGGIIGGVIYNDNIKIWEYLAVLAIWCGLVLLLRYVKMHNVKMKLPMVTFRKIF